MDFYFYLHILNLTLQNNLDIFCSSFSININCKQIIPIKNLQFIHKEKLWEKSTKKYKLFF